jgi:pimeloyl-ACP methyl ester carboxylesterase
MTERLNLIKDSKLYIATFIFLFIFMVILPGLANASSPQRDVTFKNVQMGQGVKADVAVTIYGDETQGACTIGMNGFAYTKKTWAGYANEAISQGAACFVAIDLPGRGESGLPKHSLMGDLTMDQDVAALLWTVKKLEQKEKVNFDRIVGHSRGGLLVQMMQQSLLNSGSSLQAKHGITTADLLAPAPSRGIHWALADDPVPAFGGLTVAEILVLFFSVNYPDLGDTITFDDVTWQGDFINSLGNLIPGAPTLTEVANGLNTPEPLKGALQLVGLEGFVRPNVEEDAFATSNGTMLNVVTYSEDTAVLQSEGQEVYEHLTGDTTLSNFYLISGINRTHATHFADPAVVLNSIN